MDIALSFDIEHRFSKTETEKWFKMWWTQCFYVSGVYMLLVHWGQRAMKGRKKFILRRPLFLWNLTLAIFSAIGSYRVGGYFLSDLKRYGWRGTICRLDWMEGQSGLWCFLFGIAKLPELFDTVFVVLRKQKLIFLHWYHHITVFCYCWNAYVSQHGQGRMFIMMNYLVHTVMYTYYAVRAQGIIRLPRCVSVGVTCLQLTQMVVGMATFIDAYLLLENGVACNVEYSNILFGLVMYFSYAILFGHFFYINYVKEK